ncbi:MAG TPA: 2-amino-4-hydroxy-6-hydroxymethyldihydropteridine diphosphokinase [Microbacterium sp.]|jgi:2-amino-4-hydroxy-6-hydroxymethyldihydropteridine diphosphokinase|nr:2-amino-4-hydroxy-6-hydroxymethyldihydropteridine diphosphokinase [Microbacterium sp.]
MNRRLAEGFEADPQLPRHASVRAVVALGANLGDREETLRAAIAALRQLPLVDEVRASKAVESVAVKPEGLDAAAPAYLNAVALVTTRLAPSLLLAFLQAIETRHGRERHERWGDRTLDLDLIAYGDVISRDAVLTLPHPRAAERDFVLVPWLSLDADAELPGKGRVDALLEQLRSDS